MLKRMLKFITLVGLTVLMLGVFVAPVYAAAPDILDITFEHQPLFSNINIMPGDSVTRYVEVHNKTTDTTYPIATEAYNVNNSDHLGDVMDLTIFDHNNPSNIFYAGTLTEFFNAGVVELSDLAPGATVKYDYHVYFQPTADNDYQGKTLVFDIKVGDGDSESTGGETGGGGGGGYSHHNLIITEEATSIVGSDYVVIEWHTRDSATSNPLAATSRVIYDTVSHPNLAGCSAPNYCYAYSNTEDSSLVISHSMTITGLAPNTTYYFRPVSHASPEKVGTELSFTTLSNAQLPQPPTAKQTGNLTPSKTPGKKLPPFSAPLATIPAGTTGNGIVAGQSTTGNEINPLNSPEVSPQPQAKVAGVNTACQTPFCPWWIWLLAIVLHLALLVIYPWLIKRDSPPVAINQTDKPADMPAASLNKQTQSRIKYVWLWWYTVAITLLIIYLLFTLICYFPVLVLAVILASYLIVLIIHHLIVVKRNLALWPFVPLILAAAPIAAYLYCQSWHWWIWLLVVIFYAVGIIYYYLSIVKAQLSKNWYRALILITLLIITLEFVIHFYLPCL